MGGKGGGEGGEGGEMGAGGGGGSVLSHDHLRRAAGSGAEEGRGEAP